MRPLIGCDSPRSTLARQPPDFYRSTTRPAYAPSIRAALGCGCPLKARKCGRLAALPTIRLATGLAAPRRNRPGLSRKWLARFPTWRAKQQEFYVKCQVTFKTAISPYIAKTSGK